MISREKLLKMTDEEMWLFSLDADKAILFWSDTYKPSDFVNDQKHPLADDVIKILQNPVRKIGYMGYANCRICEAMLGSHDYSAYGMVWPQKAEHYIIEHNLWVPELEELLERSKSRSI